MPQIRLLFCAVLIGLASCAPPPAPESSDASGDIALDIGPCAQEATLFGIDLNDQPSALPSGATLAITRGFQGLFFVRVGLRTSTPLPSQVRLAIRVTIAGELDQTSKFQVVHAAPMPEGGYQTTDVPFFFNDTTMAELIGRTAQVTVWSTTTGCVLKAAADVELVSGSFMGADAAFWQDDSGSP